MMTYEEALRYYAQIDMMGSHLGLDRMAELLRRLGNPEKQLKFLHENEKISKEQIERIIQEVQKSMNENTVKIIFG